MSFEVGRKFWIAATAVIVVVTLFVVGRNSLHAVKIKRQINAMTREKEYYRTKIEQDSTLLERLQYDDYLEEYARENYHMQRRGEHVYIIKEYAGRRLPESVKCGGLQAAVFCYGCRGAIWLPRDDMPAER